MASETRISLSEIIKGKEGEISPNLPGLISLIEGQVYLYHGDDDDKEQENDFLYELLVDPIAEKLFSTVINVQFAEKLFSTNFQYTVEKVTLKMSREVYDIEYYIRKVEKSRIVCARKSKFISVVLPYGERKTLVLIYKE